MNVAKKSACWAVGSPAIFVIIVLWTLSSWSQVNNQAEPGDNAVYSGSSIIYSHAFIDASQVGTGSQDICIKINAALTQMNLPIYNGEGVIDARGITNLSCSINPWQNPPSGGWPYVTVLLPAGTINIPTSWIVPNYTRVSGEGSGITVLKANAGFTGTPLAMISMGINTGNAKCPQSSQGVYNDCNAVIIEHLGLNANSQPNVIGIANYYSQELSRASDIAITGIGSGGIGLDLSGGNSGPYSNISVSGSGGCARISAQRGVHGLTCNTSGMTCSSGSNPASICFDGPSSTIEDVTFTGSSMDGILVGSVSVAQASVLMNISGGSGQTNVIELSNNGTNNANATDITIVGATGLGGSVSTIKDDLTGTNLTDPTVGLYVVGEPMFAGSYSRFTTSTSLPTWLVGQNQPVGNCATGDLFSATSAGTFWECTGQIPGSAWVQIPTH